MAIDEYPAAVRAFVCLKQLLMFVAMDHKHRVSLALARIGRKHFEKIAGIICESTPVFVHRGTMGVPSTVRLRNVVMRDDNHRS